MLIIFKYNYNRMGILYLKVSQKKLIARKILRKTLLLKILIKFKCQIKNKFRKNRWNNLSISSNKVIIIVIIKIKNNLLIKKKIHQIFTIYFNLIQMIQMKIAMLKCNLFINQKMKKFHKNNKTLLNSIKLN